MNKRTKLGPLFVVIFRDSVYDRIHECEESDITIGRADDCEIRLPDPTVSRNHALLQTTDIGFRVRDLGSRNGTILNGQRLTSEAILTSGSGISIGPYLLTCCFTISEAIRQATCHNDCSTRSNIGCTDEEKQIELPLTPAQLRVFKLIVQGFIEKEVAKQLGISVNTVHEHVKAIYKTLLVSSRGELIVRWGTKKSG